MGERLHNSLIGTHGPGVNWDAVLGAGFKDAPKNWTSVFREVTVEEMVRIAGRGLEAPPPELWLPEIREEMELLDTHRPADLARRGVSRMRAVYAVPAAEMATSHSSRRGDRVVLEMKVDPSESYVGDVDLVTCLIPFMGVHRYGLQKHPEAFKKYWESVIPLSDFLEHYERLEAVEGYRWVAKLSAPKDLPRTFFVPEVLVMSPMISQRHIRIHRKDGMFDEEDEMDDGE